MTNVASSVVGIDSSTISETRNRCRKNSRMIAVRITAVISSSCTPAMEVRMDGAGVGDHQQLGVGRQLGAQRGQLGCDGVGDGGGVGAVLLGQPQQHARVAVDAGHAGRHLTRQLDASRRRRGAPARPAVPPTAIAARSSGRVTRELTRRL